VKRKEPKVDIRVFVERDLQRRMRKHPEIKWSAVAAEAFEKKLRELKSW
jgi:hypothetical protein